MDSNIRSSYFDSALYPFPHQPAQRQQSRRPTAVNMTNSPYYARTHPHSNPSSSHRHLSPSGRLNSYYPLSQQQSSLSHTGYSPYTSDGSAASAESPLSSSSANESPLPELPIDSMENDTSHVVNGDDYYPYNMTDDLVAAGYLYPHAPRAFALTGYVAENPEVYKQPVAAPLPMPLSVAMGYTYSPEVKKFQPLCPSLPRHEMDPQYTSSFYGSPPTPTTHPATHPVGNDVHSYRQDFDVTYQPQAATSSYPSFPATAPTAPHASYQQSRQNIKVESIPDLVTYTPPVDVASSPNSLGVYDGLFDAGSPPIDHHNSGISELTLRYMPNQSTPLSSMSMPVLPAPIPRQAYLASSIVNDCERTCQEQEQQRQALRVQTQGLQQRTVRPAEVSPVMGFADLPKPEDEDAECEPDIPAFYHHGSSNSNNGHSSGESHTMPQGYDFTQQLGERFSADAGNDFNVDRDEDADGIDEATFDDDDDYGVEEMEDDDGDGDFVPHTRATSKNTRSLRSRSFSGRNSARYHPYGSELPQPPLRRAAKSPLIAASTLTPGLSAQVGKPRKNARSLPVPVPVPNLTKKSRGRRVPTVGSAGGSGRARGFSDPLGSRIYLCDISGCGKCFARGEHLKRHIRSIHTNEKPHKCPYPGCCKEFSRHDNLGQHMKVHKDLPKMMERMGVVDDG